jgi:hypothetical protein
MLGSDTFWVVTGTAGKPWSLEMAFVPYAAVDKWPWSQLMVQHGLAHDQAVIIRCMLPAGSALFAKNDATAQELELSEAALGVLRSQLLAANHSGQDPFASVAGHGPARSTEAILEAWHRPAWSSMLTTLTGRKKNPAVGHRVSALSPKKNSRAASSAVAAGAAVEIPVVQGIAVLAQVAVMAQAAVANIVPAMVVPNVRCCFHCGGTGPKDTRPGALKCKGAGGSRSFCTSDISQRVSYELSGRRRKRLKACALPCALCPTQQQLDDQAVQGDH